MPPLKFEDPPPGPDGPLHPDDVAELVANTGQWARIDVNGSQEQHALLGRARRIRDGRGTCRGRDWDVAVRKVNGGHALYVRHIAQEK